MNITLQLNELSQNRLLAKVCSGLAEVSADMGAQAETMRERKEFYRHAQSFESFARIFSKLPVLEAKRDFHCNNNHVFRPFADGVFRCLLCEEEESKQ